MTLVNSSEPGAVDRDKAMRILLERAVLTTTVCRELVASEGDYAGKRPRVALNLLRRWVGDHYQPDGRGGRH